MSNYTKITDFAAKDALSTGNPSKIVKGTEIDDELAAISGAIASKADSVSPTFTGTPAAPTAAAGTSSPQIATTAFLATLYPVGTVYTNISVSTNPAVLFGFGTWVAITGRVIVGFDSGDTAFDTAGETGGSKDAVLVSHTHTDSGHTHDITEIPSSAYAHDGSLDGSNFVTSQDRDYVTRASQSSTANLSTEGVSATNANLQPYVVAYVWKRTA